MERKKSPKPYLRMTLDARLDNRNDFNPFFVDEVKGEMTKTSNLAKRKSPRGSVKPGIPSGEGNFWKNKSPPKKNSITLEKSPAIAKTPVQPKK